MTTKPSTYAIVRPRIDCGDDDRCCKPDANRVERSAPVGEPPDNDVVRHLECARDEEDCPDRDRPESERREPQRREHRYRAEEQRGEHDEPERTEHAWILEGATQHAQGLWRLGTRRRRRGSPRDEPQGRDPHGAEGPTRAGDRRDAAEHRAEQCAADRGCERGADETAAPPAGDAATSHASAPVQEKALASPCRKRATSSCHGIGRDPEEHGAQSDRREPNHYCGLNSGARGDDTARDGADECPGRVRGRQHSCAGLAEAECFGIPRQQRGERREEERVEEDDRACQKQEPAHAVTLPIRDEGLVGGTCRPCVPRARARWHGVPARRQRVGSRCRDEPVGRRGLRASWLRLPPDSRALLPADPDRVDGPERRAGFAAGEPVDVARRLVRTVSRHRCAGREGASEPADGGRAPRLQAARLSAPLRARRPASAARRCRLPRRDRGEGETRRA